MTKEQTVGLLSLLKAYGEKGKRREVRRYVRYSKHELEANLREIAAERARGAEPHRRPHLRYIKRRSIQGLAVIDAFYASIKKAA